MSTNFHTPHAFNFSFTAANANLPLGQLDQAITNLLAGADSIDQLNLGTFTAKTIASGAITTSTTNITIDTEGAAATDDLDTISGLTTGDVIFMRIANDARRVRITEGGNISTPASQNYILTSTKSLVMLVYDGTKVRLIPITQKLISAFGQTTLTISSDSITPVANSRYVVDTEGAASTDNLSIINATNANDGDLLFLSIANASRVVVLKHLTSNIYLNGQKDITLNNTSSVLGFVYNSANSRWIELNYSTISLTDQHGSTTSVLTAAVKRLRLPEGAYNSVDPRNSSVNNEPFLSVMPNFYVNLNRMAQANGDATISTWGMILTESGTPALLDTNTGPYVRWGTGASTGNFGGFISTFNYPVWSNLNQPLQLKLRTYTSIAVCRIWIGISSAAIGNTDSPTIDFAGIRYSTVVGDTTWKAITNDSTTQTVSDTGVTVTTDTSYDLQIIPNSSGGIVIVVDNTPITMSATIPSANTLGLNVRIETREAVNKSIAIQRLNWSY